jgi:hypothetical protein
VRAWIARRLARATPDRLDAPDKLEDNDRLGRFWLRGEIPVVASDAIPANSELSWLPYDRPSQASGPYKDVKVTYKTNARGWRSREILPSPNRKIMFVGCSFTMGVGLPYDEVWTSIVTRQIEAALGETVEQHNFGYPAHANDFFAMVVHQVLPILKPDLLIVLFTEFSRRTLFHRFGRLMAFLPNWLVPGHKADHKAFILLQSDSNDFMDFVRQHSLIDAAARLNGVPWIWQTWGRQSLLPPPEQLAKYVRTDNMIDCAFPMYGHLATEETMRLDLARDGKHPGPRANESFGLATSRFLLSRGLFAKSDA